MNWKDAAYQINSRMPGQTKRGYSPIAAALFASTNSSPDQRAENFISKYSSPVDAILERMGVPEQIFPEHNVPIDYTNVGSLYANAGGNRRLLSMIGDYMVGAGMARGAGAIKADLAAAEEAQKAAGVQRLADNATAIDNFKNTLIEKLASNKNALKKKLKDIAVEQSVDRNDSIRNLMAEFPEFEKQGHDLRNIITKTMGRSFKSANDINNGIPPRSYGLTFEDLMKDANFSRSLNPTENLNWKDLNKYQINLGD